MTLQKLIFMIFYRYLNGLIDKIEDRNISVYILFLQITMKLLLLTFIFYIYEANNLL